MKTELYEKYKVTHYQNLPALNPLSFILRKAELQHDLTVLEWDWLRQHQLFETMSIIKNQQDYLQSLPNEINNELTQLKLNEFVRFYILTTPSIDSEKALTLYKISAGERLIESEMGYIDSRYHDFLDFINDRKQKYGITEAIPFDGNAKSIFTKLDKQTPFSAADIEWLYTYKSYSFLTPLYNQFSRLQQKYQAFIQEGANYDQLLLCLILQKLDENQLLNQSETEFLQENSFTETLGIVQKIEFAKFKEKYHATQIQEDAITCHLYKVLKKLEAGLDLPEADINYLKKRKLLETLKFVYKKTTDSFIHKIEYEYGLRPDDVAWCEQHNFKDIVLQWLKQDYGVKHRKDTSESLLYVILKKLAANERLNDDEVVWLEAEKWLLQPLKHDYNQNEILYPLNEIRYPPYESSKVYIAYHILVAQFNETEFQRTKDHWKLANASAHWRKAKKPKEALKQTNNLDFEHIKPAKLTAALLTTRGGALRDIEKLGEAEQCALQAIKYYPNSHNPYTLMGALCYDTRRYHEGDKWFAEAIKRGAEPRDQDAEIKRIFYKKKNAVLKDKKDKNKLAEFEELIDHLFKKDPERFYWVKADMS